MSNLLSKVPELKLVAKKHTRTIHKNDRKNYPSNRVGDVIELVTYVDAEGVKWTSAQIEFYLYMKNYKVPENYIKECEPEVELELT